MQQPVSPVSNPPPSSPAKFWIRTDAARVWGPYPLEVIGRLSLGTTDPNRVEVSTDGRSFESVTKHPAILELLENSVQAAQEAAARKAAASRPPPRPPPPPPKPRLVAPVVQEEPGPPAEGDLAAHSTIDLYARAASLLLTGKLTFRSDTEQFEIFFKKGTPEHVAVLHPGAALARFLTERGTLREPVAQKAVADAGGPDADLLPVLFAQGLVPQHELFPLLGEYAVTALSRALTLESGRFAWTEGVQPPPGSFKLGERWDLLCQWARALNPRAARRRLGDRAGCAVYRAHESRISQEELHLTAQEIRITPFFDGTRSPEQIAREFPGETEVVFRTMLLLADVGFLSFGPELRRAPSPIEAVEVVVEKVSAGAHTSGAATPVDGTAVGKVAIKSVAVKAVNASTPPTPSAAVVAPPPAEAKPLVSPPPVTPPVMKPLVPPPPPPASLTAKPIVPPPPPARPSAPPPPKQTAPMRPHDGVTEKVVKSPKPAGEDLAALKALLAEWKDATHFEVLGVDRKAQTAVIRDTYFALAKQYHPDTVADSAPPELRKLKEDLTARLNEAYQVLTDEEARKAYVAELDEGAKVDIGPILQAEEDFLRATIMVKARKFAEAIELIDRAIALNPNEAEFYAWRAWARFAHAKDKRQEYDAAVAECARVAKENPMCVAAHLFTGNMSKIIGDHARAEAAYKRVLAIEPDNIEAARELRLARR